jgi:hypothetical protein
MAQWGVATMRWLPASKRPICGAAARPADGEAGAVAVAQGGGGVERRGRQAGLGGERA